MSIVEQRKILMHKTSMLFGFPVCILDHYLQSGDNTPRWKPRCRLRIFVRSSLLHANNAALMLNHCAGLVFSQSHLIFHNHFTTASSLRKGTITFNWEDPCNNKSAHASHQDTNDSLLLSSEESTESENEGDVPELIEEYDTSVGSVPPNKR